MLVPVTVVVCWESEPPEVAKTVAVLVCLIVVVTTVVEVPVPRVYVKVVSELGLGLPVATAPTLLAPVPRGTEAVAVMLPAETLAMLAEKEDWAAELADSASVTGQIV